MMLSFVLQNIKLLFCFIQVLKETGNGPSGGAGGGGDINDLYQVQEGTWESRL